MEFYEKYITILEAENSGPERLDGLRQEAIRSLREDSPEQALTQTGQMVAAFFSVAQRQNPLEQSMVNAVNELTALMIDYLDHLGWHQRAVKTTNGWVYEHLPPS